MARQGAKRKRKAGFQIVPQGEPLPPGGGAPQRKKHKTSVNTLRDAHKSSQQSKADELWFRKCGHGEVLFRAYYTRQPVVPAADQVGFWAALGRPLPVTFRVHGHTPAGAEAAARLRELAAATSAAASGPVVQLASWAPVTAGAWQANVSLDKRALSKGGAGAVGSADTARQHESNRRNASAGVEPAERARWSRCGWARQ